MSEQEYTIEQIEAALSPCSRCGGRVTVIISHLRRPFERPASAYCECGAAMGGSSAMDAAAAIEMMNSGIYNKLAEELIKARIKHPNFVPRLVSEADYIEAEMSLAMMRLHLESIRGDEDAINTLVCEVAEAAVEIVRGNKEAALTELAQAGAVIVRMMEMVKREMGGGRE